MWFQEWDHSLPRTPLLVHRASVLLRGSEPTIYLSTYLLIDEFNLNLYIHQNLNHPKYERCQSNLKKKLRKQNEHSIITFVTSYL